MTLFVSPRQTEPNLNGIIAAGWTYYFYEPGTSTPKTVYADAGFTTARGTSVTSDANGRFPIIYINGSAKVVLKDALGVEQWTEDNYPGALGNASLVPTVATLGELQGVVAAGFSGGEQRRVAGRTSAGDGYQGYFFWKVGDFSAEIAADTQSGIYVKANDVAATVGAWVRSYGQNVVATGTEPEAKLSWFDANSNPSAAFNGLFASTHLQAGTYDLDSVWSFGLSSANFRGDGIDKTVIKSDSLLELIKFTSDCSNVSFSDLTLRVDTVDAVENLYGLVNSEDLALNNISFTRVKFTAPDANTNAVKIINQDASITDGVHFSYCDFNDIGRMGIEFQNHNDGTPLSRYRRVTVEWCRFKDCGLSGSFGMGVSLSGIGDYCSVTNNTFDNCLDVALEGVGVSNSTFAFNKFNNLSGRTCAPVSFTGSRTMYHNKFIGNICEDNSYADGNVNIRNQVGATLRDNTFKLTGHVNLQDCVRTTGGGNNIETQGNYALLLDGTTNGTHLTQGYYDNTASGSNFAAVRFSGASCTGNLLERPVVRKGTGGSLYDQVSGATANCISEPLDSAGKRLDAWRTLSIPDADYDLRDSIADLVRADAVRINGTLTAGRNLVLPNYTWQVAIWNNTGQTLTVKTAAGSGEALAAGQRAVSHFDGTNIKLF